MWLSLSGYILLLARLVPELCNGGCINRERASRKGSQANVRTSASGHQCPEDRLQLKVPSFSTVLTVSSYTSSSLTLRSLLKSAASRLRLGVPASRVSGLTGP